MTSTRSQAGQEPAEDLARRFEEAIRSAGWVVLQKNILLLRDRDSRGVFVEGAPPGWKGTYAPLELLGFIRTNGDVEGTLRVHCVASNGGSFEDLKSAPRLRDGSCESVERLRETLRNAIDQRELILRRIRKGEPGPYLMDGLRWDNTPEPRPTRRDIGGMGKSQGQDADGAE